MWSAAKGGGDAESLLTGNMKYRGAVFYLEELMRSIIIAGIISALAASAPAQQVRQPGDENKPSGGAESAPVEEILSLSDLEAAPAAAPAAVPAQAETAAAPAVLKTEKKPARKKKIIVAAVQTSTAAVAAAKPAAAEAAVVKPAVSVAPETEKAPAASAGEGGFIVAKKHEVSKGETLWDLSYKYYGDPFKWGKIYNANMDRISDPDRIYPGEEIEIPEMAETVKPVPLRTAETREAAEPAAPAAAEGTVETPVEEGAPAVVAEAAKDHALPASGKAAAPVPETTDLSMEMPDDQKEWAAGITTIVPENWKEDGVIISKMDAGTDSENDSLTSPGDLVRIKVWKPASFQPGERIYAYMRGSVAYDKKTIKKLGLELQKTGVLEVLSVEHNIVNARILNSNTSVDSGQVVKI